MKYEDAKQSALEVLKENLDLDIIPTEAIAIAFEYGCSEMKGKSFDKEDLEKCLTEAAGIEVDLDKNEIDFNEEIIQNIVNVIVNSELDADAVLTAVMAEYNLSEGMALEYITQAENILSEQVSDEEF